MLSCDVFRITWSTIVVWVLLIMSTLVLSAKEVFQLMHSQKLYFLNWENWVQWGIIINVVMVSFHTNPFTSLHSWVELVSRWQHHAAAIGVFLVWGELMLMVGRLPTFGKGEIFWIFFTSKLNLAQESTSRCSPRWRRTSSSFWQPTSACWWPLP